MLGLWLALVFTASPETVEIQLTAERLLHDGKKELTTAEGRAKLVTEGAAIDADRIVYDRNRSLATATGHVVARIAQGGKIAIVADLMTVRLDEQQQVREVFLFDGQAIAKKDLSTEALLAADTAEKVEKVGGTQALLQGNHLVRDGRKWTVDELELVPCECDFKNPSWSVTSSSATIDTEAERVSITNPVFRIKHVPVLWLPWLSLPLTDRQSGLLFTRPGYSLLNGFTLEQPVYLTLGRSADLTLTPGLFTGVSGGTGTRGVAGPKLAAEFRYTPSSRATGRLILGLLYDFRSGRDVDSDVNGKRDPSGKQRGLRGEFGWQHTQDFDQGFGARVDVSAHSDGDYNRDLTVDIIASTATYLRSTAALFHRGDDHFIGLDVGLRQDIQWGYDLAGNGGLFDPARLDVAGQTGQFGPGTLQRFPALSFGWAPSRMLGPIRFELEADAVRLAPLFSRTGDEGVAANDGALGREPFPAAVDRLFNPGVRRAAVVERAYGSGDRIWQLGEREARDRFMVLPRLSITAQPLGVFSASAFAAWRQLGWIGEASGRTWSRGYLLLGGRLETEVSRSFASVRHVIQPLAEVRAIPFGVSGALGSPVPYDAVDAAVPDITPRFQGVLELRQRLVARDGAELLRLDVGQGFELGGPALGSLTPVIGETFGRLSGRVGWFSAQGLVRLDPVASRWPSGRVTPTRIAARADLDDARGHGAYVAYENLLMEGTARSRQPIDLLFLIDRGFTSATGVQQLSFGASWNFGPVSLRYDGLLQERTVAPAAAPQLVLAQQTASVGISPACDCWRVDVAATQQTFPTVLFPQLGFNVTISKFGSIGSR